MQKNRRKSQRKNNKITKIEITNDKISGRGGLALFLRYVEQIGFYPLAEKILVPFPSDSSFNWQNI